MRTIYPRCTSQGRNGVSNSSLTQNRCVNFQRKLDIRFSKIAMGQRPVEISSQISCPGIMEPMPAVAWVEWWVLMIK